MWSSAYGTNDTSARIWQTAHPTTWIRYLVEKIPYYYTLILAKARGSYVHEMITSFMHKIVTPNVPSKLCARTQVVRRVHRRKLGVHIKVSSQNFFAHYFIHIHVIPNSDEFR